MVVNLIRGLLYRAQINALTNKLSKLESNIKNAYRAVEEAKVSARSIVFLSTRLQVVYFQKRKHLLKALERMEEGEE